MYKVYLEFIPEDPKGIIYNDNNRQIYSGNIEPLTMVSLKLHEYLQTLHDVHKTILEVLPPLAYCVGFS